MTLKQQVINWILSGESGDYSIGFQLLRACDPQAPAPEGLKALQTALGAHLRRGINDKPVILPPQQPVQHNTPVQIDNSALDDGKDHQELSTQAKINLDLARLKSRRTFLHNSLHKAQDNNQRRKIVMDADEIQKEISYLLDQLRALEQGKAVSIKSYQPKVKEDPFEIPENILEHDRKIRQIRMKISRRRKILDEEPEGSKKYDKAVQELNYYERAKSHLTANLTIRTESQK